MSQITQVPTTEVKAIAPAKTVKTIFILKKTYVKPSLETQGNYTALVAGAGSF